VKRRGDDGRRRVGPGSRYNGYNGPRWSRGRCFLLCLRAAMSCMKMETEGLSVCQASGKCSCKKYVQQ